MPMREDALPQPVSPYGVSKLAAEQLCYLYFANFGVPTVSLRYFTVYGPRQRRTWASTSSCARRCATNRSRVYGDGEQTRDFTLRLRCGRRKRLAARRGIAGRVYNIGGGSRSRSIDVLDVIGRVTGRRRALNVEADQKGDMRHTYADTSSRAADLGFVPTVGLEEGLDGENFSWLSGML